MVIMHCFAFITSSLDNRHLSNDWPVCDQLLQDRKKSFVILYECYDLDYETSSYQLLIRFGVKPQRMYNKLFNCREKFYLILFPTEVSPSLPCYPFNFHGLSKAIKECYPLAYDRTQQWYNVIQESITKNVHQYIDEELTTNMCYETFISLPEPCTKEQVIQFLVHEMHLDELHSAQMKSPPVEDVRILNKYLCCTSELTNIANQAQVICLQVNFPEDMITSCCNLPQIIQNFADRSQGLLYGRICSTANRDTYPQRLSDTPKRQTAFVFGPETINTLLLQKQPYDILLGLGMLPKGIYHKRCFQRCVYWLILLSQDNTKQGFNFYHATWKGVLEAVNHIYPKAYNDLVTHLNAIKTTSIEAFEKEAQFQFFDILPHKQSPNYLNYDRFCQLPNPRTAWQVRLFLYCELHLFELFSGDGHTRLENNTTGEKEYICRNYCLQELERNQYVVLPLCVDVPESVIHKYNTIE